MGDFNVNTILETKNYSKSDFIHIFSSCYYHKLINLPTYQGDKYNVFVAR